MVLVSTFENEVEAQLLASQLKAAGIDLKIEDDKTEGFQVFVFEDDVAEALEILETRAVADDDFIGDINTDDIDLDEFADE
ncbi:MAG: DUF2007 domain-containing protein [Candidatus Kapabacteria bacterium]|nr:DUF2007 domain-containing protein [Candidatus Kapabacteria bacterium]